MKIRFPGMKNFPAFRKIRTNERLRLVVQGRETFEEKFFLNMNLKSLYIFISSLFVIFFILFYLLIAYTPVRKLIPGYASIEDNVYVMRLNKSLNELEEKLEAQDLYNESLRRMLTRSLGDNTDELIKRSNNGFIMNIQSGGEIADNAYVSPLRGKVNRKIDFKNGHYGIDIGGLSESAIRAMDEGNVIFADWSTATGYTIILQHRNGLISIYKHNASLLRDIGEFVDKGEAIAVLGNSGSLSTGPHLHFEVWRSGVPIDPLEIIDVRM